MTDHESQLNDQTLRSLYAKFQEQRRVLGGVCPQAFYYDFIDQGRYDGGAMLAILAAQDHMNEIANTINRLHYDVHSLMAWEMTLASVTAEEQWQALFEFVFPLASHSLSSPYSIKQKLITSIYEVSYHANRFADLQFKEEFNKRPKYHDAERMSKGFSSWPNAFEKTRHLVQIQIFTKRRQITVTDSTMAFLPPLSLDIERYYDPYRQAHSASRRCHL